MFLVVVVAADDDGGGDAGEQQEDDAAPSDAGDCGGGEEEPSTMPLRPTSVMDTATSSPIFMGGSSLLPLRHAAASSSSGVFFLPEALLRMGPLRPIGCAAGEAEADAGDWSPPPALFVWAGEEGCVLAGSFLRFFRAR